MQSEETGYLNYRLKFRLFETMTCRLFLVAVEWWQISVCKSWVLTKLSQESFNFSSSREETVGGLSSKMWVPRAPADRCSLSNVVIVTFSFPSA